MPKFIKLKHDSKIFSNGLLKLCHKYEQEHNFSKYNENCTTFSRKIKIMI